MSGIFSYISHENQDVLAQENIRVAALYLIRACTYEKLSDQQQQNCVLQPIPCTDTQMVRVSLTSKVPLSYFFWGRESELLCFHRLPGPARPLASQGAQAVQR